MSQLNIGLGYQSDTSHGQDFEPFLSSLFLYIIPIFEGSQNNPTKIQDDRDANTGMKMQRV